MDEQAPTVVVAGASAGGVEALTTLASGLPEEVALRSAWSSTSHRAARADWPTSSPAQGPLPATQVRAAERLEPRRIYVARSDHHLVVRGRDALAVQGLHEYAMRPSIDVLFRSAALSYGRRTVAAGRLSNKPGVSENGTGEMSPAIAYADGAVDRQRESVEAALWTAISALQERAQLSERLAERVGKSGATRSQRRFEGIAEEARGQAETIRRLLAGPDGPDA
jgi:hypothetical protein